jgi:hypothetical protein
MSDRPNAHPRASRPAVGVRARTAAALPEPHARDGATTVRLTEADAASLAATIAALPEPATLPAGTLVLVPGEVAGGRSLARSVLAVFGRLKVVPRTRRCTALVARGYLDVGAAEDATTHADLAWGRSPGSLPTDGTTTAAPTEPC